MSLMLLIKSYLMERYNQSRIERHLRELSRAGKKRARAEIFSKPLLYAAIAITGLILAYLAGRVVLGGQLSLAGFAAIGLTLAFAVFGLNRSVQASVRIRRGIAAATQIDEFLERRADAAQPIDAEFLKPMTKSLDFVEVSYREPGTGRMILDGVSFSVAPGMRAAIICSQDAEADILPLLMTRFVETTGGEIRIDGKNTRWVTFESLRTQIALVRQDTLLFSDTVTNNIGCGEAGFTLPQIIEAAKKAHAHQFIQALPYGYETPLGDGGVSLRPGEQFRIALARAILRDPSILVIEEPLEPYDADSTALIADTLTRIQPQRTILILARRGSTIRASDRYVLLRAGKIAGSGSPDQLRGASEVHQALSARN
jgi:ABC-type multidrug transport system fused ATPase/permease subunit